MIVELENRLRSQIINDLWILIVFKMTDLMLHDLPVLSAEPFEHVLEV